MDSLNYDKLGLKFQGRIVRQLITNVADSDVDKVFYAIIENSPIEEEVHCRIRKTEDLGDPLSIEIKVYLSKAASSAFAEIVHALNSSGVVSAKFVWPDKPQKKKEVTNPTASQSLKYVKKKGAPKVKP